MQLTMSLSRYQFGRLNTLKGSASDLVDLWREEGVAYEDVEVDWAPKGHVYKVSAE